jgi:hypothetical protein
MRPTMMLLALTLTCCGGGQSTPATAAVESEGAAAGGADQEDAPADAGTRLEQCERLGALIEETETGTTIVNVNDRSKMAQLAERRRAAADDAKALPLSEPSLVAIRDRYADLCGKMAEALEGVASPDADARAAAVKKHDALDADVSGLVDELNTACAS